MNNLNITKSLKSSRLYGVFVVECAESDGLFVIANTDTGLVRAPLSADLPFALNEGLYVMQASRNGDGSAHVQFKTGEPGGNRDYGWAFDSEDPAIVAVAR